MLCENNVFVALLKKMNDDSHKTLLPFFLYGNISKFTHKSNVFYFYIKNNSKEIILEDSST